MICQIENFVTCNQISKYFTSTYVIQKFANFRMFFVELNEQEEVAEEDEIDKSIQEIHQSAQNLSDSIVHIAGASSSFKLSEDENFLISGGIPDKGKIRMFQRINII